MTKQSVYITTPCPTCGQPHKTVNGILLRQWREAAKLDQRAFGRLCNASGPYISDIERNRRACPQDVMDAYVRVRPAHFGKILRKRGGP